jgi:hypothetical protein
LGAQQETLRSRVDVLEEKEQRLERENRQSKELLSGRDDRINTLNRERDEVVVERDSMRESISSLQQQIQQLRQVQEQTLLSQSQLAQDRDKKASLVEQLTSRLARAAQVIKKLQATESPEQIKRLEQELEEERLKSA